MNTNMVYITFEVAWLIDIIFFRMDQLMALTQICDSKLFTHVAIGTNFTDASLIRDLDNISIKLNDSLHNCKWHGDDKDCSTLFRPILTENGICFTFNSLNSRDIYSDLYE